MNMGKPLDVLIVEDSEDDALLIMRELQHYGYDLTFERVDDPLGMGSALERKTWDIVLSDYSMPQFNGLDALRIVKERLPDLPFIIVTGAIGEELAANLMREGARDFVLKGNLSRLVPAVDRELEEAEVRRERTRAEEALWESEEQIRLLMDSTAEGIYGLDTEGNCIFCNNSSLRILGYDNEEELLGKNMHSLIHHTRNDGTAYPLDECHVYKAFRKGINIHEGNEIFWRKDGSCFYCEYWSHLIRKEDKTIGSVVTFVDITERKRSEDAIRDSELKYRTVFENSKDGISIYERAETSERKLIDCNPSYVGMSGRAKEELLAVEDIRTLQASSNTEYDTAVIQQKIVSGLPYWGTFSWKRPDGKENYVEYEAVPLEIGVKTYIYVIDRDITARKKAEEMLRESEQRYRSFVQNFHGIAFRGGIDYKPAFLHGAVEKITGYVEKDFLEDGLTWDQIVHKDDLIEFIDEVKKFVISQERSHTGEYRVLRKDGEIIWVQENLKKMFDSDGNTYGVEGAIYDITDRKLAEDEINLLNESLEKKVESRTSELNRALKDTEQARGRIDTIIKSVADGLIVTDIHNNVVLMNRAAEGLLDVEFSDVMGHSVDSAISEETLREMIKNSQLSETGCQYDFEKSVMDTDHPLIMRARTSVIYNKYGEQSGTVTSIHDVTHEREVDRLKTEFISTAAHELRTPLTSIMGFSEILLTRKNIKPNDKKRYLTHINRQAVNLKGIIDDLLDISRIESGKGFTLNKGHWYMHDCIEEIIPYFKENATNNTFFVELPQDRGLVYADKDKIGQVLKNLISNAVKYSPDGGEIKVKGESANGYFQVSVIDNDIGMTLDQVENIFEKFYRVDASDSAIEGTGLGMTIVKYIVEAHGGTILVDSKYGEGTIVSFTIPTKEEKDEENTYS